MKAVSMKKLIYVLAAVKFALPFLLQNAVYEPHRDEFLYLAEARHMAWGYLELPPVLSALSFISNLFGGSLFWIKFWPSLGGALTYVLVGRMILLLGGGRFALLLGWLPFVFGYFLHVHFMLQPNFLEMLACTAMAYGLMLHVRTGRQAGLYIAGLGFGLGMLSKYSVAFFAAALLVGLLVTPERRVLRNRHLYISVTMGLLIFLPNLIWQARYGWPVIHHMTELKQEQLDQVSRGNFLLDQLSYNLPGLLIWAAGLYWLFFTRVGKPYRFAGWTVLLVLAFLTVARGKSYYAMEVYPVLFGCGAVYLERLTGLYRGRLWWRFGLVVSSVIAGCYLDMIALPMLPPAQLVDLYIRNPVFRQLGFLRWEDQRNHALPQDFADMFGWKEMTAKTAKIYHSMDSPAGNETVIDGGNYGEGSAIDYYGVEFGLPPAMGHGANYLLWTAEDFYTHNSFILITDNRDELHGDFMKQFTYAAAADSISTPFAREYGSYIILMKQPTAEGRKIWKEYYEGLRAKISVFGR
jgi:Dolichyl-phosphate-mannose-protein mannosyltransferase